MSIPAGITHPTALLASIEHATGHVLDAVHAMDEISVHRPSLLPNWTRAHVISHLARGADGCVNLLTWARTGVEHPMYTSKEDRDADIREGGVRSHRLLLEDLRASSARLIEAARSLSPPAWTAEVVGAPGKPIPAYEVLRSRLLELWVHLVDLDYGFGMDDIPATDVEQLLQDTVRQLAGRPDVPAVTVVAEFEGGTVRSWDLGMPLQRPQRGKQVRGHPGALLGWLLGRTGSADLHGDAPEMPPWL
ncbi:maleylpyruvate isomerase [Halopolyspora algeriensis]|uniref:Maleylpyruvate isomerase n=1 Tax=Halopolyspora algeriensis TaxID=1500506 RepID=A0A368VEF7_9ACTN|nr:maleylpyruvate isomerase family mycothiol-dependent enzyme [Halopolyspora algeriensis]RCW39579.1 maleylpyruvate isomerase [Halopolyspora algeriensis]TQM56110.1 maleylpyruvate isomerase [Halopolyspora algeriensis]